MTIHVHCVLQEAKRQEHSIRTIMSEKEIMQTAALEQARSDLNDLREKLQTAQHQIDAMQKRKAAEMEQVEQRVKAAIHRKDSTIGALRDQLSEAYRQIRTTQDVLTTESARMPAA